MITFPEPEIAISEATVQERSHEGLNQELGVMRLQRRGGKDPMGQDFKSWKLI